MIKRDTLDAVSSTTSASVVSPFPAAKGRNLGRCLANFSLKETVAGLLGVSRDATAGPGNGMRRAGLLRIAAVGG